MANAASATFSSTFARGKRKSANRSAGATGRGRGQFDGRFWALQAAFWPVYAAILMVPWIGVFTIGSMIPNKVVVALTGMLAGIALRPALGAAVALRERGAVLAGPSLGISAIVVTGLSWELSLSLLVGHPSRMDVQRLGSIIAGVPQLSGLLYHVLIVAAWSMAWLLVRAPEHAGTEPAVASPAIADPVSVEHIAFRDGRTTHVFGTNEIDWVGADGDYVTIHAGRRRVLVRATMSATDARLPPSHYVRIHRSAIVRVAFVRETRPRPNNELEVILRDGTALRASRNFSDRLRSALGRPASN